MMIIANKLNRIFNSMIVRIFISILMISNSLIINHVYAKQNIDSRIKIVNYDSYKIYDLITKIDLQSRIELNKNEIIQTISMGRSHDWKITPMNNILFVKPLHPGAKTNLTVITNKRIYLFDLISLKKTPVNTDIPIEITISDPNNFEYNTQNITEPIYVLKFNYK